MSQATNTNTTPMPRAPRRKAAVKALFDLRPPALPATTETWTQELIGMDVDGKMYLWSTGNVRPVTSFELNGRFIDAGHFVIQWKGQAITVHCGDTANGLISVQFMCSRGPVLYMPRVEVEAMLLGKVIPDPEHEARILAALNQLNETLANHYIAPHRGRGSI